MAVRWDREGRVGMTVGMETVEVGGVEEAALVVEGGSEEVEGFGEGSEGGAGMVEGGRVCQIICGYVGSMASRGIGLCLTANCMVFNLCDTLANYP